jgi:glutaminase
MTLAEDACPEIERILPRILTRYTALRDGQVADYIPELAWMEPDSFGIALATAEGEQFSVGDAERPFTIQSVSKALTFCLALELAGPEMVRSRVGVEPSGDAFNAIEFDPVTRRPYNPMVNAGAIAISGLLYEVLGDDAFEQVLERFSAAAGRRLTLDEAVYRSEVQTGHRNRAIGHLLLSAGALSAPVEAALDLYFRQCSILVTATDLARIGATLSNLGEQPWSGRQVFELNAVRDTLSVMFSCGVYDYSGNWANDVGIPAKSGVGGGILGVVSRQLGLATFSPRLDAKGNSVRGVSVFKSLAAELGLHVFDATNLGSALIPTYFKRGG